MNQSCSPSPRTKSRSSNCCLNCTVKHKAPAMLPSKHGSCRGWAQTTRNIWIICRGEYLFCIPGRNGASHVRWSRRFTQSWSIYTIGLIASLLIIASLWTLSARPMEAPCVHLVEWCAISDLALMMIASFVADWTSFVATSWSSSQRPSWRILSH